MFNIHFTLDRRLIQALAVHGTKPFIKGWTPPEGHAIDQPGLDSRATWGTDGLGHCLVGAEALSGKGQDLCIVLVVFVHVRDCSTHPTKK